jgi:hypothetical protein
MLAPVRVCGLLFSGVPLEGCLMCEVVVLRVFAGSGLCPRFLCNVCGNVVW